jgi:hypothetical protein
MYSQILLEKDPSNGLVAQFQPMLASLSVQANEPLNSDNSDSEGSEGEDGGEEEGAEGEEGVSEDDSEEDSDDPESAWMWSDTWRTDP